MMHRNPTRLPARRGAIGSDVSRRANAMFLITVLVLLCCGQDSGNGPTSPPPPGAVADPTLLPVASGQQKNAGFSYGWDLPAGGSYADPLTGVLVYRVTDASNAPERAAPTYSEGGPYISLRWGDGNWYTLFYYARFNVAPFNRYYFVDFNIATGEFTNRRLAPSGAEENTWSFSFNPSTPRIGYASASGSIERYDTEAMAFANTGNFPKDLVNRGSITQMDMNDEWFVTQEYQKEHTIFWNSVTDVVHRVDTRGVQPRIDRAGNWGFPGYDRTEDGMTHSATKRLNLATGALDEPMTVWQSHPASVVGGLAGGNPRNGITGYFDPAVPEVVGLDPPYEIQGSSGHFAGQWVINNRPGWAQWMLFSAFKAAGNGSFFDHSVGFIPLNYPAESCRILAHHNSTGLTYESQPHATISPDGRLVMWGSDQGGGRIDVYLAVVPAR
ncbi:MAG: hypothetical protein OEO20_16580 [Gemmatimonadota bacterium]|nr:hypothetical protein [Gemmatimonadota bacterium]